MVLNKNLGSLASRPVEGDHEEMKVDREAVHDGHLRRILRPNYPDHSSHLTLLLISSSWSQMRIKTIKNLTGQSRQTRLAKKIVSLGKY